MIPSSLAVVLISLASALTWGAGDFSGGLASKRTNVLLVVAVAHGTGLVVAFALALLLGEDVGGKASLFWGGAAGWAGAVGLVALYRGLAVGAMGVVAPIAAVLTAALPVMFGVGSQGAPKNIQLLGFTLAVCGIVLISKPEKTTGVPKGLWLAVLAGIGFGFFLVFINRAGSTSVFWPLVSARVVSVVFVLILMVGSLGLAGITTLKADKRLWAIMLLAGFLDMSGNVLFVLASRLGRLDVAAVLSSLYPAATVLLARIVLNERVSRMQNVGMVLALASIPLIAA
jgi:drug/metabolite transporter (DMT)-like permease